MGNEKVLGFRKKDAIGPLYTHITKIDRNKPGIIEVKPGDLEESYSIDKSKLVPVVSLAWLEDYLKGIIKASDNSLKQDLVKLREDYIIAKRSVAKDLLSAVGRGAEKR